MDMRLRELIQFSWNTGQQYLHKRTEDNQQKLDAMQKATVDHMIKYWEILVEWKVCINKVVETRILAETDKASFKSRYNEWIKKFKELFWMLGGSKQFVDETFVMFGAI